MKHKAISIILYAAAMLLSALALFIIEQHEERVYNLVLLVIILAIAWLFNPQKIIIRKRVRKDEFYDRITKSKKTYYWRYNK